jgi:wyosine [tRNA(Phe)-imidazoG37] synthetase (radical SAM superfamily)
LLFMFGSVNSLLKSENRLFEKLDQLPFYTYINVGLESIDQPTLEFIGKPVGKSKIREAFKRMLDINAANKNIEVTANFVIGKGLSAEHYESLKELLQTAPIASRDKGAIYLSPLKDSPKKRELLPLVKDVKKKSKLPVYVYLIQRL